MTSLYLILDAGQADSLRGPTSPGAELRPLPLADGERWVLPLSVRDDPAHASRRDYLLSLPVQPVMPEDFPQVAAAPAGGDLPSPGATSEGGERDL